jgi:ribonuclease VapC
MFIDASAIIAMLTDEAEGDAFADALAGADRRLISAIAIWEAVAGLVRTYTLSIPEARAKVEQLLTAADVRLVPIAERELGIALDAYTHFGKGRHPARLNMGDCFAYAGARSHDVALLFKGDDFDKTDIPPAISRG